MKLLSGPSARVIVAVAVIVALGATGVAVAATSGAGKVHACYAKKGGALRHVGSGTACKSDEVALTWNKRGRRGPAGSARAYAAVNADATLDTARSKNIDHVSDFGTGSYCVFLSSSIDLSTIVPIVSLFGVQGTKDTAIFTDPGGCLEDSTAGIYVTTTDLAGAGKPAAFYLMVP